jgi:hypothetical protein
MSDHRSISPFETVVAAMQPARDQGDERCHPGMFVGREASTRASISTRAPCGRCCPARALLSGMFLTVRLAQGERDVLTVPEETLVPEQGNVFVYVVQDDKAEKRKIQTGQRRVGSVQVLDGLQAGEMVVTEGTQKLRDGAAVRLVQSGAAGNPGAPPPTRAAAK